MDLPAAQGRATRTALVGEEAGATRMALAGAKVTKEEEEKASRLFLPGAATEGAGGGVTTPG